MASIISNQETYIRRGREEIAKALLDQATLDGIVERLNSQREEHFRLALRTYNHQEKVRSNKTVDRIKRNIDKDALKLIQSLPQSEFYKIPAIVTRSESFKEVVETYRYEL